MKSFRCPVPEQAARAFANVQQLLEPLLRQCLGTTAVPWEAALNEVCGRLESGGVDWWLCGSAALAVRGVADARCGRGRRAAGGRLIEPVCPAGWPISNWWGRAFLHARVEWVGGVTPAADEPQVTDYGPAAANSLQAIRWRAWDVRVPPLHLQRAVSARRGMADRVALIDRLG